MNWILLAFVAAWFSGLAIPIVKILLEDMSPFHLIVWFNLPSFLALIIGKHFILPGYKRPAKGEMKWLLAGICTGPLIGVPLVVIGMTTVSGSITGLLLNLEVVFTFFLAFLFFREKFGVWAWAAMTMVFLGSTVAGGSLTGGGNWRGALFILSACFLFGLQSNFFKKCESVDSFVLGMADFLGSLPIAFLMIFLYRSPMPELKHIFWAGLTGVVTFAFSNVLYFECVKRLGAGRTSTIFGAAPLLGAFSALVILKDPVTSAVVVGASFIFLGIAFLFWEERKGGQGSHQTNTQNKS